MERTYIVAVGHAGAYKAAETIVEHEKELRSRYRSSFVDRMLEEARTILDAGAGTQAGKGAEAQAETCTDAQMETDTTARTAAGNDVAAMHFMPGGYLGALYDLAEEHKCGIRIRVKAIPISQSTVEICEMYGMNPYQLPAFARIVLTQDPQRTIEEMDPQQREMAACIGYLTGGHDKVIVDKTNIEYINKVRLGPKSVQ